MGLAINRPGLREQGRPFTPTGLAADEVLEFTIKGNVCCRPLHRPSPPPGRSLLTNAPAVPGQLIVQSPVQRAGSGRKAEKTPWTASSEALATCKAWLVALLP